MNESFATPVKYMVVDDYSNLDYATYSILDTSFTGQGRVVCQGLATAMWAHHICKLINHAEGFKYYE